MWDDTARRVMRKCRKTVDSGPTDKAVHRVSSIDANGGNSHQLWYGAVAPANDNVSRSLLMVSSVIIVRVTIVLSIKDL